MTFMTGLDTNILFYAIDNSDEVKHLKSIRIIQEVINKPADFKVSLQVIAELNYAVKRKKQAASRLASELSEALLSFPETTVHYTEKELRLALTENKLFDALMAYTYVMCGCTTIYTENLKDMPKLKSIKFINPFL